jgi:hypothetical protein
MPTGGAGLVAGITDLLASAGAGAGLAGGGTALAGAGADLGVDAGLAAAAGGDIAGLAGATDLLGGGGGATLGGDVAGAALPATTGTAGGGLAGAAAPLSTAAGITPATAAPIDLASAAAAPQGDVSALFTGSSPAGPWSPSTAGAGTWSDASEALSQGLNPANAPISGTAAVPGGAGPAATDLSALTGATNAPTAGTSLAGAGGASGTATPGTASTGFFDSLTSGATNAVTKNPLGIALSAGGLGYSILEGQKVSANEQALQAAAGTQAGQGQQLSNYIQTGQLPPGLAAQVANATAAAKAAIISGYASRGQNADPSQNSALAQELSQVDMNALAMQGQLATQLLTAGLQESNMSDQLYAQLIGIDQTQAKNTGAAISNFASALAGGPKTIQLGGTTAA